MTYESTDTFFELAMAGLLCRNRRAGVHIKHSKNSSHMYLIIYSFHAVHVNIRADSHPDVLEGIILLIQCGWNKWALSCRFWMRSTRWSQHLSFFKHPQNSSSSDSASDIREHQRYDAGQSQWVGNQALELTGSPVHYSHEFHDG